MRLTDLEKLFKEPPKAEPQPRLETRETTLTTEQVVKELKTENSLAKEKLEQIPSETKEALKPLFNEHFWKEGIA